MITCEECDVAYSTFSGIEQKSKVNSGWTYSYVAQYGDILSISAQNNKATGSVIVAIFIDGSMMKRSQSEGEYVIASADHFIGN